MSFPFQDLPYEIQVCVGRYALWTEDPIFITIGHYETRSVLPSLFAKPASAKICRAFYDAAFKYCYEDRTFEFASRRACNVFARSIGPKNAALVTSISLALSPLKPRIYPSLGRNFPNLRTVTFIVPAYLKEKRSEIIVELEDLCRKSPKLSRVDFKSAPLSSSKKQRWMRTMIKDCNDWLERKQVDNDTWSPYWRQGSVEDDGDESDDPGDERMTGFGESAEDAGACGYGEGQNQTSGNATGQTSQEERGGPKDEQGGGEPRDVSGGSNGGNSQLTVPKADASRRGTEAFLRSAKQAADTYMARGVDTGSAFYGSCPQPA